MDTKLKPWKILESTYIVKDSWMTLRADKCQLADSEKEVSPYYVIESPDFLNVVALNDKAEVLLVRQYRHGLAKILVEIPGGMLDQGESPIEGMKRELLEETGILAKDWHTLESSLAPCAGRFNNRVHSFVAFGAEVITSQKMDPNEDIEFFFAPFAEVEEMIHTGKIIQADQIATFYLARKLIADKGLI